MPKAKSRYGSGGAKNGPKNGGDGGAAGRVLKRAKAPKPSLITSAKQRALNVGGVAQKK